MARFHSHLASAGGVLLLLAAVVSSARAQSDLFLFTPTSNAVSVFTTNAGSTPTSIGSISGGGSTSGFASVVRGDQAFAYVSYNGASDSIQVINTATQSVVQTVALAGGDPRFMVSSPNGSTLYVANGNSNNVLVYSVGATTGLLTQTSTITFGAGTQPRALAISPDGSTLYVGNQSSNSMSVVNTATNTITATIGVGSQPISIAINPAGTLVYVGNASSSNVSVINTATNTVATTINVGAGPSGIVVSPNGQYLYLTATAINQVRVYDTSSNALIGTFASASSPVGLAISPDGSTLYVTNNGSANAQAFSINASSGLLTSLGVFSTTLNPASPGMCGNGSSANGILGNGGTFLATSKGALGCAGSSATMSGGTIVAGVNNLVMATPIVLASQGGTVDTNGNNLTLGGAISGTGNLTKIGLGILTLSGSSTYAGATNVNVGTLQAGATNAFSPFSAFTVASGATLGLSNFNQTIGSLAGAGAVTLGTATLTAGNDNTGTIFSGTISGTGGLTKTGSGALTLAGSNTYTGATTVNAGALIVNGSIAGSAVTVNAGGTLAGTGTVGATTINGSGTLAPGNSPGTIAVAGNLAFQSGAIYLVQVTPSVASSTNVSGSATLNGSVQTVFTPGSYVTRQYTILHSAGLTGTFSGISGNVPAGFGESLSYTGTDVILTLVAALGSSGLSGNQANVAGAVNTFFNGGALPPAFVSLFGLTGGNLGTALSQLSGEAATGAQQGAFQLGNQFLGIMLDPFVDGRSGGAAGGSALGFAPERPDEIALAYAKVLKAPVVKAPPAYLPRWSVWGGAYGGTNRTTGDPAVVGSHDLSARAAGFAGGFDYRVTPDTIVGFALAGGGTKWSLEQGLGGGRSDAFQAGVYGATRSGPAYLAAALAYTQYWMSTDRFAFAGDHLTASFNAQSVGGRVEGGYRFGLPVVGVTPYAALQAQSFHTPTYSEIGTMPGGFALAFGSRNATDTRSELGARFDRALAVDPNTVLTLRGRLAWAHDWVSGPALMPVFQSLPGASFIVNGAVPAKDSALASAGAELRFANGITLLAKFDGDFAAHSSTYAGTGTIRYSW